MPFFYSQKERDFRISSEFEKRFDKIVIVKDRKTGFLHTRLRSKSEAVVILSTKQKKPKVIKIDFEKEVK